MDSVLNSVDSVNASFQARRYQAVGRKDHDKQEAVIELDAIKERMQLLITAYKASQEASDAFNDAVKATAEKSGILASVVRKFVVARAGEKFSDKKRESAQMSLLFEDVGE